MLETIAAGVLAGAAYDVSKSAVVAAYRQLAAIRPDLEGRAQRAADAGDNLAAQHALEEATNQLIAEAGRGSIQVDGAVMSAIKQLKFDHQHGRVEIGNTTLSSNVLVTGGSAGSTGETVIGGNTSMKSAGTSIEVGEGALIRMTGGASIKQN